MTQQQLPFIIEHRRKALSPSSFEPQARIAVTDSLRTGGLLARLSDEQARTLLALLTFLSPNGVVQANVWQVAAALDVREGKAAERLERLVSLSFQERPVAFCIEREGGGTTAYTLSPLLIAQEQAEAPLEQQESEPQQRTLPARPAGREAVIAHSRAMYARPREEVEKMVLEQLGHSPLESEDTPEGQARRSLRALGVPAEQVNLLLAHHSIEKIQRQIDWLPHRHAKSPSRFIMAAIENDYEPPAYVRLQQAIAAEEEEEQQQQKQHGDGSAVSEQRDGDSLEAGPVSTANYDPKWSDMAAVAEEGDETKQEEIHELYRADEEVSGSSSDVSEDVVAGEVTAAELTEEEHAATEE